ncbi:oxidoreductase, partial [Stutzerimonas kirkiae]
LVYEVQDMKACILNKDTDYTLQLSLGVMNIMDEVRSQWGIRYPFE